MEKNCISKITLSRSLEPFISKPKFNWLLHFRKEYQLQCSRNWILLQWNLSCHNGIKYVLNFPGFLLCVYILGWLGYLSNVLSLRDSLSDVPLHMLFLKPKIAWVIDLCLRWPIRHIVCRFSCWVISSWFKCKGG